MSNTEHSYIGLETQQDSDSSDEDIQVTEAAGHRRAKARARLTKEQETHCSVQC